MKLDPQRLVFSALLLCACADDVEDTETSTDAATESAATMSPASTSAGASTTHASTDASTDEPTTMTTTTATSAQTSDDTSSTDDPTTGFTPSVGEGVFLYTGAGGNNYDTNAEAVEALFADAGVGVTRSDTIAGDIAADHGCLVLLNPTSALPPEVSEAAQALIDGGGRVVFQTEHSGYGGHEFANELLSELGATMRSLAESEGGYPELTITPASPLTDGVSALAPFFVARVELGAAGEPIATIQGTEWVVIARESVGNGEVVIVTDGSMFGYSLDEADNRAFIRNFAEL